MPATPRSTDRTAGRPETWSAAPQDAPRRMREVIVLPGDGIGPEIMKAALRVLKIVCPVVDWTVADGGGAALERGVASGLPKDTVDTIARRPVVLKGPFLTPEGRGSRNINVTLRRMFELYGNIRPIHPLPGLTSPFADRDIDFFIVRENVEDLYAGIEYMQTPDVAQSLKLISRRGSEKVIRLAYGLAARERRRTIHCATKSDVMRLTEGMFKDVFDDVGDAFARLARSHIKIDACAHQLVTNPEQFDVIVTTNMHGDILGDLAAGLVGGLILAPSAQVGDLVSVFEPVHGAAPDLAGRHVANPTAMMRAGAMMLRHMGFHAEGERIDQALHLAYEDGRRLTADVARDGDGVGTEAFTDAVLEKLEEVPVPGLHRAMGLEAPGATAPRRRKAVRFEGVDVFVEWSGSVDALATLISSLIKDQPFDLELISNRFAQMYPEGEVYADPVDHWRCRFSYASDGPNGAQVVGALLDRLAPSVRWMHVEQLVSIDGTPGYSSPSGVS